MDRRTFLGAIGAVGGGTLQAAYQAPADDGRAGGELMPAFFIGHGRPLNAIEDNRFTRGWTDAMKDVPPPEAILCISAHWRTRGTYVTAMSRPRTIHDHGVASRELNLVRYPAPGSPTLASDDRRRGPGDFGRAGRWLGPGSRDVDHLAAHVPECRRAGAAD